MLPLARGAITKGAQLGPAVCGGIWTVSHLTLFVTSSLPMWDVQLNDPCRTPPPPSISILLLAHTRQRVGVQAADSVNDVCVVICTRMWGWPRQFARRTPSSKSGLVCPWPLELERTVASASYVFSTFTPACVVGLTTKSRREMDNLNVCDGCPVLRHLRV